MLAPPRWTAEAACDGLATAERDPWHPDGEPTLWYAVARRVCAGCPVRVECATYGLTLLSTEPVEGMFGGLTPYELRQFARDLELAAGKVAQHGTRARYVSPWDCRCGPCRQANARFEHARRIAGRKPKPERQVRLCSIPGCGRVHYGRGWCHRHYWRWKRWGDPLGRPALAA